MAACSAFGCLKNPQPCRPLRKLLFWNIHRLNGNRVASRHKVLGLLAASATVNADMRMECCMIVGPLARLKSSYLLDIAADSSKGTLLLVMTLELDLALDNTTCKAAKATKLLPSNTKFNPWWCKFQIILKRYIMQSDDSQ